MLNCPPLEDGADGTMGCDPSAFACGLLSRCSASALMIFCAPLEGGTVADGDVAPAASRAATRTMTALRDLAADGGRMRVDACGPPGGARGAQRECVSWR